MPSEVKGQVKFKLLGLSSNMGGNCKTEDKCKMCMRHLLEAYKDDVSEFYNDSFIYDMQTCKDVMNL